MLLGQPGEMRIGQLELAERFGIVRKDIGEFVGGV
jgi:hypothetical protein